MLYYGNYNHFSCNCKNQANRLSDEDEKERLATETALLVASFVGNDNTALEKVFNVVEKVTPVRYECGLQDASGQEENCEHFCSHF